MKAKETSSGSTTRSRILESARKIFSSKGYAASIREIAEASGTTLPSLYYYFGNKEGLFQELMQKHFEKIESRMKIEDETGNARDQIKNNIVTTYNGMVEEVEFIRLMLLLSYGPPQGAPPFDFKPYYRHFHDNMKEMIQRGIKNGEFRPGNVDDMVWVIRGAMQIAAEDLCFGSVQDIDQKRLERILDIILDGFSARVDKK